MQAANHTSIRRLREKMRYPRRIKARRAENQRQTIGTGAILARLRSRFSDITLYIQVGD